MQIGDHVFWRDPDRSDPCDGWGEVKDIQDNVIILNMDDGSYVECFINEIDPFMHCGIHFKESKYGY